MTLFSTDHRTERGMKTLRYDPNISKISENTLKDATMKLQHSKDDKPGFKLRSFLVGRTGLEPATFGS